MIIQTEGLTKRFKGQKAVQDMDLAVPEGAAMAMVGANGAGKTTTLRLLTNILTPDKGRAEIMGVDSRRLGHADLARIGYVSENQKLPERLTIGQFFDYLRPLYPTWDRDLERELRAQFDLPPGRRLGKLSHGMRMKACLAAVLPFRPKLLILDEPLSGLDPLVRDEVVEGLLSLAGEMTVLISSHELTELEGFATHVAFMDKGRLIFQDSVEAIGARTREVVATLRGPAKAPASAPPSWIGVKTSGQLISFVNTDYDGDEALGRQLAISAGEVAHFETRPMSLRDLSKALMRAHRREPAQ